MTARPAGGIRVVSRGPKEVFAKNSTLNGG